MAKKTILQTSRLTMLRFINDVVKPWEELDELLVQRFAFQPDLSDVTRLASSLAVSMHHLVERPENANVRIRRQDVHTASEENRLISDVADYSKHGPLRNPSRDAVLSVASCFEYQADRGFRFIRNSLSINHASAGEHDFLDSSLVALEFWMQHFGFSLDRKLSVSEGPDEFFSNAYLYFNPRYCINMKSTKFKFFQKDCNGNYELFNPPEVRIEVFDMPDNLDQD